MEKDDDPKLRELLREWRVPPVAPASLDRRVWRLRSPRWKFLLTGSIRIPVPVGLAIVLVLLMMGVALLKQKGPVEQPTAQSVNLVDFRPVSDVNVKVIRQ